METKTYRVTVTLDPSNFIDVVATSWNIDNDNMLFFYIDKKLWPSLHPVVGNSFN
jgi:hypothetical protein